MKHAHNKAPNPVVNRSRVIANYAISGHRDSPFENVEAKRPFSKRARRLAMGLGVLVAGAVVTTGAIFGVKAIGNHEKETRTQAAATQVELKKTVKSAMIGIDRGLLDATNPGSIKVTPAGTGAPKGAVKVTDLSLGSQNQPTYAVMGTYESGPKEGQPNPNDPIYYRTDSVTPSHNQPMLGSDDGFVLSSPDGATWAQAQDTTGGPKGEWYGVEFNSVDTSWSRSLVYN